MVNVPPIPPLLCSTPPPIDFGDDDDDVLPPTLGGVADEEYGDFSVGDSKSDEPLPSPRPQSVTDSDLPPMSIYDGLIPPDKAYTNHSETPPPMDIETTNSETTNKTLQSTPIVEAFNYSITQQAKEAAKETTEEDDQKTSQKTATPTPKEDITTKSGSDRQFEQIRFENNIKMSTGTGNGEGDQDQVITEDERCEKYPAINVESNVNIVKHTISPLTNMVSIEDLEDDLSEDELYSPKTPKNFTEADAMNNDYFKIQNIQQEQTNGEISKPAEEETSKLAHVKTTPENGFSASAENAVTNFPLQHFASQDFNIPPPLDDLQNSSSTMNDDDFGDFADFQDFNTNTVAPTVTNQCLEENSVTVNAMLNEQPNDDTEDDFEDFVQHKCNKNGRNVEVQDSSLTLSEEFKDPEEDDFDDFSSHTTKTNKNHISSDDFHSNDSSHKEESPENSQHNEDFVSYSDTDQQNEQSQENLNESYGDFDEATLEKDNDSTKVWDDVENPVEDCEDKQVQTTVLTHDNDSRENGKNPNDDNDDDFADFEEHQKPPKKPEEFINYNQDPKFSESQKYDDDFGDDDDDDFGDFNTAEPITAGQPVPTIATIQTSQPLSTASLSLQTPKNLNERISKILHVMFTSSNSAPSTPAEYDADLKKQKIQDIPFTSIDAAKALEYQWLNSETRHSFIKSLGIDSRNILYGENWNPSLPRFAANLSFNPLKPMKPVTSNNGSDSSCPPLDTVTVPVYTSDFNKPIMNPLGNIKRGNIEIDWKTPEQKTEAFNDNTPTPEVPITSASATVASAPYVATEPPESLTIFENSLANEDTFSKTPPISEMESVNNFSSPLPTITTLEIDLPPAATQILNSFTDIELNGSDDSKDALEVVVASTTFSGSFKETHIYTPPKTTEHSSSTSSTSTTSPTKANNIDFDYDKAAMGVIINETVVKKEYRDIEYNSPFTMDSITRTSSVKTELIESSNSFGSLQPNNAMNTFNNDPDDEFNDEFSDFQSVPSEPIATTTHSATPISTLSNLKPISSVGYPTPKAAEISKPSNVSSVCGMILSPAILIPQAISMESNKPKIEWGDSTTSINPEELARIEELFPEPMKLVKSNNSNSSQKSTPTHQTTPVATAPTISAAVANKELEGNNDDDDWSDFVSVPIANNNKMITNNNVPTKSLSNSPFKQRSPVNSYKTQNYNNSNNDDEWSDFVSSAPPEAQSAANTQGATHRVPQFNSGAWQNANFYNNPLSLYHKGPLNPNQHQSPKNFLNNNNNYNQYNQFQTSAVGQHSSQQQHHQQIHIMQNFSTAPVPTPDRITASGKNNQFQVGSAKVAPSIALIPDLGFVAPAIPTHTSFINSLPKPSINTKK